MTRQQCRQEEEAVLQEIREHNLKGSLVAKHHDSVGSGNVMKRHGGICAM